MATQTTKLHLDAQHEECALFRVDPATGLAIPAAGAMHLKLPDVQTLNPGDKVALGLFHYTDSVDGGSKKVLCLLGTPVAEPSPSNGAVGPNVWLGSAPPTIAFKTILAQKYLPGFRPQTAAIGSAINYQVRFSRKSASAWNYTNMAGQAVQAGGTDDVGLLTGPSGIDLVVTGPPYYSSSQYFFNRAEEPFPFVNIGYLPTNQLVATASSPTGWPWDGATTTLSLPQDPGFSYALAAVNSIAFSTLADGGSASFGVKECIPVDPHIYADCNPDTVDAQGMAMQSDGTPADYSWADFDPPYDGSPYALSSPLSSGFGGYPPYDSGPAWTLTTGPTFGLASGWAWYEEPYTPGNQDAVHSFLYVGRSAWKPNRRCRYWYGEIRQTGGLYGTGGGPMENILRYTPAAWAPAGAYVEIPQPSATPAALWPYIWAANYLFINITPADFAAANPTWTIQPA